MSRSTGTTKTEAYVDPYLERAAAPTRHGFCSNQWTRYRAQPPRKQLAIALFLPVLGLITIVGNRVMNPSIIEQVSFESDVQERVAYESLEVPLNFLDITGAEYDALTPQSQIDYLLDHLPAIESRLLGHSNDNYTALLSHEAARLRQEAIKEASGDIDLSDPTGTLDIAFCLTQMQGYQCVLFRYAGDGLAGMGEALRTNDIARYTTANARYQAALYALNDLQPIEKDPSSQLILADNYRVLLRQVVSRSPASQRPPVAVQGAGTKGESPIRTFVEQQGYKSEQLQGESNADTE